MWFFLLPAHRDRHKNTQYHQFLVHLDIIHIFDALVYELCNAIHAYRVKCDIQIDIWGLDLAAHRPDCRAPKAIYATLDIRIN